MSRSRRKPYHHGDLRRALLEAAGKLLETQGPSAVSFRKLAEALDVSHAAPLAHFPDRVSLDAALAAEGFRQVRHRCEQMQARPDAEPSPGWSVSRQVALHSPAAQAPEPVMAMRLVTAALVYLRFALEHPGLYRVMHGPELAERLGQESDQAEPPLEELADEKARAAALFEELARQGQQAGEFRTDVPAGLLASLVLALTEGLAQRYLEEGSGVERLPDAERLFEAFLGGFFRSPA